MKIDTFPKNKADPTVGNPPLFAQIGTFATIPTRGEINGAMSKAGSLIANEEKQRRIAESMKIDSR